MPKPDPQVDGNNSEAAANQLVWNLTNHTPTPDGIKKIEAIRHAAKQFGLAIINNAPHTRERSTAITNLEQAVMHATAAIARNETEDK